MNATASPIFAPLDAANLETQGLLGPIQETGSRRCHKRRLNRSSDEEYQNVPLDISLDSFDGADAFVNIPDALISRDALRYLGFSEPNGDEIWSEWTNWPSFGPSREIDLHTDGLQVTFIDFITARLGNLDDAYEDDDMKWLQCLDACGMSLEIQNAIMDSNFKNIRMTTSCVFWVTDTIDMRYAGLKEIQRTSREREIELQHAAIRQAGRGHHRGPSSSTGTEHDESTQHAGQSREPSSQGKRSLSGAQAERTPGISSEQWSSDVAKRLRRTSENIVLYKGIDLARIPDFLNEDGTLQNIETLLTKPPSDFSGTRMLFYFASDVHVAEYYAAYAKRRSGCEAIAMVTLSIPRPAINDLKEPEVFRLYYPSPQWKQLTWRSKTSKNTPKPLRKYRDATVIIGTISTGAERKYKTMASWEDIDSDCVLRIGSSRHNSPAEQYVFSGEEEGREFLTDHGRFEVFRFSNEDVEALLRRYT